MQRDRFTCSRPGGTHMVWPSGTALPSPGRGRSESGAREAHNVTVSRARDAPSAAHTWRCRAALLHSHCRGGGGMRAERERSESGTQRDRLARSRRAVGSTHLVQPSGAALSLPRRGRGESKARAARNVSVLHARDTPSAAHTWCCRTALPSLRRSGGGGESGARAAHNVSASRDRSAPSAALMVLPHGTAHPPP